MTKTIEIPSEFRRLFDDDWREAAIYGGRYSLKSHTVGRYLLINARARKTRVACFREFQNSIAESSHQLLHDLITDYELTDFKVTDNSIINTINGSDFLFKGLHNNEQSIKSIEGIDIAWVEEAQSVSKESIDVLTPTVRKPGSKIIYTYNRFLEDDPVHQRLVVEGRPNTLVINVTYEIALKYGMMPDVIKAEMEDDREKRPLLYRYKWLGEPRTSESKIYKNWVVIDDLPKNPFEYRLERLGLDFGYTNDPTAIVALYKHNEGFIVDQVLYRNGMPNREIANMLLASEYRDALVIADSAEPKSIDEIKGYGINIIGAEKKRDSVNQGIQFIQNQKIEITRRSVEMLREYNEYLWQTDKNGRIINEPSPVFNHAMDALRYAISGYFSNLPGTYFVPDRESLMAQGARSAFGGFPL